ncbi:MAG: protein kinase [Planctomycetales bacterium]|nr:protein kinase [Planctomycetales bacterium]
MGSNKGEKVESEGLDQDDWADHEGIPPPPRAGGPQRDRRDAFMNARLRHEKRSASVVKCVDRASDDPRDDVSSVPCAPEGFHSLELIGRGGMGLVCRAKQASLNRTVAIKFIQSGIHATADERIRFQREAESAACLSHPNIVRVHEVAEFNAMPYLVMEYVTGGTLSGRIGGLPVPARLAAEMTAKIADGIELAHRNGIVHRDLKPSNILLSGVDAEPCKQESHGSLHRNELLSKAIPKIADFGLAKQLDDSNDATRTGLVIGTPNYMAPEQAVGDSKSVGPATDIYAIGAILYELLVGRPPFVAPSTMETLDQVRNDEPLSPKRLSRRVPTDLCTICLKCLQKNPSRRYQSASELADDLRRYLRSEPIKAKPAGLLDQGAKWMRRHPARSAFVASTLIACLVLAVVTIRHNRVLAAEVLRSNRNEANAIAQKTLAMNNFQLGYQALDDLLQQVGRHSRDSEIATEYARQLYDRVLQYYYQVLSDADESDSEIRQARGSLLVYAGSMQFLLGRNDKASDDLQSAFDRLKPLHDTDPTNLLVARFLARCQYYRGRVSRRSGDLAKAIELFNDSVNILDGIRKIEPEFPHVQTNLAQAHSHLGEAYLADRSPDLADDNLVVAVDLYTRLLDQSDADESLRVDLGETLQLLVLACIDSGQLDEAIQRAGQSESNWKNAPRADSDPVCRGLAETYRHWGLIEFHLGHRQEAVNRLALGIQIMDDVLTRNPDERSSRAVMHGLLRVKAWILSRTRDPQAQVAWEKALSYADGVLQWQTRAEMANEYAINGTHEHAVDEIRRVLDEPTVDPSTWMSLARIASRSLAMLEKDAGADSASVRDQYGHLGVRCLANSGAAAESILRDPELADLRETERFLEWSHVGMGDANFRKDQE